jgi:thymidine kinase
MSLVLYVGPMFAGKTRRLVDVRDGDPGRAVMVRPALGAKRDDGTFVVDSLVDFADAVDPETTGVVCVDEGQLLEDVADGAERLVAKGVRVHVAALSGTASRRPWPVIGRLVAMADAVLHLRAPHCARCGAPGAPFTKALAAPPAGARDEYAPSCRACSGVEWNSWSMV